MPPNPGRFRALKRANLSQPYACLAPKLYDVHRMDDRLPLRLKELQAQNQAELIQFLNTDLDLAFTMIQTARIEAKYDPDEVPGLLQRIRDAVRTVRALSGRIQDQTVCAKIHSRTDQLETLAAELAAGRA